MIKNLLLNLKKKNEGNFRTLFEIKHFYYKTRKEAVSSLKSLIDLITVEEFTNKEIEKLYTFYLKKKGEKYYMFFLRIDINTGETKSGEMPFSSLKKRIEHKSFFFIPNLIL